MRYLHTYLAIAMCVVQAEAALTTFPGLPYPLAPEGIKWIGSVIPGSRNVTLYGTVDDIKSQIDDLKLRPEEEWPLSTEAEEKSVYNITSDAIGTTKRALDRIDCGNAIGTAYPSNAYDIIGAIMSLGGTCGASANTCLWMNTKYCAGIAFCTTAGRDIVTSCFAAGLAGAAVMGCMGRDYLSVQGTTFDSRGWAVIIQNAC